MRPSVQRYIGEGLVIIDGELWHQTKARKRHTCVLSDKAINPGDLQYAPLGNGMNRMNRALASIVDRQIARLSP